jgi:hypothetical protein
MGDFPHPAFRGGVRIIGVRHPRRPVALQREVTMSRRFVSAALVLLLGSVATAQEAGLEEGGASARREAAVADFRTSPLTRNIMLGVGGLFLVAAGAAGVAKLRRRSI